MGRIAKAKKRAERLQKKRSQKDANRLRWQEFAKLGLNKKSKRNKRRKTSSPTTKGTHLGVENCGNLACKKCFPDVIIQNKVSRERNKKRKTRS